MTFAKSVVFAVFLASAPVALATDNSDELTLSSVLWDIFNVCYPGDRCGGNG